MKLLILILICSSCSNLPETNNEEKSIDHLLLIEENNKIKAKQIPMTEENLYEILGA